MTRQLTTMPPLIDAMSRSTIHTDAYVATVGIVIIQAFSRPTDGERSYEMVCVGPETARALAAQLLVLADKFERNQGQR